MTISRRSPSNPRNAAQAYRERSILTASSQKLVAMLIERSVRDLERARVALSGGRDQESQQSIEKVQSILIELRASLDPRGGELATRMDRLYEFSLDRLATATRDRDTTPIEEALRALRPLEQAWHSVVTG